MSAQEILYQPTRFFRGLSVRSASLWVALGAFLLIAVAEAVGVGELPRREEWLGALAGILLNWLFGVFLFGILWFYLGAKVLGGKATVSTTVRAVGYAFLWPGIISVVFVLLTVGIGISSRGAALTSIVLRGALGLWALSLAAIAVKQVHQLTWPRTAMVMAWLPVALLSLVGVLVAVGL